MSGQVVPLVKPASDGQKAAARSRATTIRQRLRELHGTLTVLSEAAGEAYRERDWATLGYDSWSAYCGGEFGTKVKLTTDERQEIVGYLRGEASMSERAISVLLGVSQPTVHRDLSGSDSNESVVKGVNGKTYQARKPKVIKPTGEPVETKEQANARLDMEEAKRLSGQIDRHIKKFRDDMNSLPPEIARTTIEIMIDGLKGEPAGTILIDADKMPSAGKTCSMLKPRENHLIACQVTFDDNGALRLNLFA
jgi:hypothetical protein